jgi:PAS domain-containing protein
VISSDGHAIGVVNVFDRRPRTLSETQLEFLRWMAGRVALKLENGANDRQPGQESDTLFRQVVEGAPNAIVMVEAKGRIVLVNSEAERLFGYSRESFDWSVL